MLPHNEWFLSEVLAKPFHIKVPATDRTADPYRTFGGTLFETLRNFIHWAFDKTCKGIVTSMATLG